MLQYIKKLFLGKEQTRVRMTRAQAAQQNLKVENNRNLIRIGLLTMVGAVGAINDMFLVAFFSMVGVGSLLYAFYKNQAIIKGQKTDEVVDDQQVSGAPEMAAC